MHVHKTTTFINSLGFLTIIAGVDYRDNPHRLHKAIKIAVSVISEYYIFNAKILLDD